MSNSARGTATSSNIAPVTTREELIYLLSRASELEHGLACVYLFVCHSLKSDESEGGMTAAQAQIVRGWKRKLAGVAIEEMLHLAQVTNMLTAIGGAPHFMRVNFPMPSTAFPFGIKLSLEPFSRETIERMVCYEMPELGVLPPDRQGLYDELLARVASPIAAGALDDSRRYCAEEPFEIDFHTVGEFYHKIETGFTTIAPEVLFIGPPQAQANARFVDLGNQLVSVLDTASACAAIEMIVQQGEAPTSEHPDAHFCVFDSIRLEYEQQLRLALEDGVDFNPVRPVVPNPMTRYYGDATGGTILTDELTHNVADLYNVSYDTMLLMLLRFFAHTDEAEDELQILSRATLRLMASVLRPLGEALTKMPAGGSNVPQTAGPGFGYNRDVHLLPHKESAWIFFAERLQQLSTKATYLYTHFDVPVEVTEAAAALADVCANISSRSRGFAGESRAQMQLERSQGISIIAERNGPYLVSNPPAITNSKGDSIPTRPVMALCRCGKSRMKPFCDGTHASVGFDSSKSDERTPDHRVDYRTGALVVHDNRGICCHAGNCTDNLPGVFRTGMEPFIDPKGASAEEIIDIVRECPSGALSYSLNGVEFRDQDRAPSIYVSQNGPYHIRGGVGLIHEVSGEGASREHYALCRCGQSKNKPFCDGSHWYAKFVDINN